MKIGIIGATGNAGTALVPEALRRGHEVTALVRDAAKARAAFGDDVTVVERDALALTAEDLAGLDVVVNAYAVPPQQSATHIDLARHLVGLAAEGTPRLVFILGAGSLTAPDGRLAVEHIREMPDTAAWISIPEDQKRELDYLRTVDTADWVGVSPQSLFSPGEATTPVLGDDEVILASDGQSHTTTGTMAVALLDEIETPAHRRTRFTVSDA